MSRLLTDDSEVVFEAGRLIIEQTQRENGV